MKRKILSLVCLSAILITMAGCGQRTEDNKTITAVSSKAPVSESSVSAASEEPAPEASASATAESEAETAESLSPAEPASSEEGENAPAEPASEPAFTLPETIAELKAMDIASLSSASADMTELVNRFTREGVQRNTYQNLSFRHENGRITYEEEGCTCLSGIDVSAHQGSIDWAAVKASGIDFIIIRAGFRGYGESGSLNEDAMFRENLAGARAAGLLVGAYFFSQAVDEAEAAEEADFVLQLLAGEALDLPLVFDAEHIRGDEARTDSVRLTQFTANACAFCERVRAAGYEPMVYTNLLWEGIVYDMSVIGAYPVWYAGYDPVPMTPYVFEYWQYSESGTVPGIDGLVDLDLWITKS